MGKETKKHSADVHKDNGATKEDIHITKGFTNWVHHHRILAKWLMKALIAIVTAILYYLRREEKHIEDEKKK